jgi:hypothetical protein
MTEFTQTPAEFPTITEVSQAYQGVAEYNRRRTGFGAAMGNMMRAMLESSQPDFIDEDDIEKEIEKDPVNLASPTLSHEDKDWQESIDKRTTEGEMEADLQGMLHEDLFTRIGIKLAPLGMQVASVEGAAASNRALEPLIGSTEQYVGFLQTVSPEQVEDNQAPLLGAVVDTLSKTVLRFGDAEEVARLPDDMKDYAKEFSEDALRTFIAIEPEYERLGLDAKSLRQRYGEKPAGQGWLHLGKNATPEQHAEKAAHDLYDATQRQAGQYEFMEGCVEYWGRNVLPEYLEVGRDLKPHEELYYFDALEHELVKRVDYIASLQFDERTRQFGQEVAAGKIASLEMTYRALDEPDNYWCNSDDSRKLLEEQIARLRPLVAES